VAPHQGHMAATAELGGFHMAFTFIGKPTFLSAMWLKMMNASIFLIFYLFWLPSRLGTLENKQNSYQPTIHITHTYVQHHTSISKLTKFDKWLNDILQNI
jgi:hypothetical protein